MKQISFYSKYCFSGIVFLAMLFPAVTKAQAGINSIGSFESDLPSYWTKGTEPAGATLTWASDQSRSLGKSLKITKSATSDIAMWQSENMADYWSPKFMPNVDILLGAYVKTQGVNTSPANDDARWWISYAFYKKGGALIGETKLPINQSSATSSGWIADTNAVGATILPDTAYTVIIKFWGGKNATGTVWADDFIFTGRGGAWAGQTWNQSVGVPTGWLYWLPPNGGNDVKLNDGFENTRITNEAAHTGLYSLKFNLPFTRTPHDGFVGTRRFPLNNVKAGDVIRISVWVKANNLVPDSAAKDPGSWSVGLTPIFHSGLTNNSNYDEIGAKDLVFAFPSVTQFDWTKYYVDVTVPSGPNVKSLSVRLHPYSRFTGTIYFDDLEIEVSNTVTIVKNDKVIPMTYSLYQNYPNPFNPSTIISYTLPEVTRITLKIYDVLGREVKTLINGEQPAGVYRLNWNGDNNFGSKVASGIYIYRIEAGSGKFIQTKKMILLK